MAEKEFNKYLVLKWENLLDICEYDKELKQSLSHLTYAYNSLFPQNNYIVVNQDETYAEEIWQTILRNEDAKS